MSVSVPPFGEPVPSGAPGRLVRLLDAHTVNQIAAGEVVERPASVVKELVENALDAGATDVRVELEAAGRRLIRVTDDGHGMPAEAARLALHRHATSKISTADDLLSLATLGFRGEALPSIASVSRVRLATATEDGPRATLDVDAGAVADAAPEAGPRGTDVAVRDLFHNTPARLKFLKSDATELSACVEGLSRYALARPDVRFSLTHDGALLLATSGSGDLATAVAEVWGRETARALVSVDSFNGSARVRGLVSPPYFTKPTRSHQWLFVNGRPVRNRILLAALDQAYRALTPEKRYPVAVLMLDVDPARLDVNVSPTKSEVKFHSEGGVFDAVRRAVGDALLAAGMVPTLGAVESANEALRESAGPGAFAGSFLAQQPLSGTAGEQPSLLSDDVPGTLPDLLSWLRVFGQIDATFILAENERGVLLIDQHVAHERVLYEKLREQRGSGAVESQALLAPETLHLDPGQALRLFERLDQLRAVGYDLEPFGADSVIVRAVPGVFRGRHPLAALKDLASEVADGTGHGCLTAARDDVFVMAACKMAVKAGDKLGLPEIERLLQDLAETENPYFCPHGRPITIVLPKSDLYRRFKR
jgi:DNA mismatch repair protein MutL